MHVACITDYAVACPKSGGPGMVAMVVRLSLLDLHGIPICQYIVLCYFVCIPLSTYNVIKVAKMSELCIYCPCLYMLEDKISSDYIVFVTHVLTLVLLNKLDATPSSNFQPIRLLNGKQCRSRTDLDLHCLQRQGLSGFSRTRVNHYRC